MLVEGDVLKSLLQLNFFLRGVGLHPRDLNLLADNGLPLFLQLPAEVNDLDLLYIQFLLLGYPHSGYPLLVLELTLIHVRHGLR